MAGRAPDRGRARARRGNPWLCELDATGKESPRHYEKNAQGRCPVGQGAAGMSGHVRGDGSAAPGMSPRETTRQLEAEIAVLRDELTGLVAELDRRRHELTD